MADVAIIDGAKSPAPAPLAGVRARLADARNRARLDLLIEGLAWSLVVGLGVACAALVVQRLTGKIDPAAPWLLPVAAGTVALALAAGVALLRAVVFSPTLSLLAQRADSVFGFDERLSTAMEISGRAPVAGWARTLTVAALAEAGERAALLDPRRLTPLRTPTVLWAMPALVLLLAVVALVPLRPAGLVPASAASGQPTGEQRLETAANLREIAQSIRQELAARPDAYRAAIARTLEAAAENYVAGTATHGELARQLTQLIDHAQRVDTADGAALAAAADIPKLIEAALSAHMDQLAQPPSPDAFLPEQGVAADGQPQAGNGEANPADAGEVRAIDAGPLRTADVSAYPAPIADTSNYDEGIFTPPPNYHVEEYPMLQFAGVPYGGADNAGKGEGDAVGRGIMPLGGEALAGIDAFGRTESIALPLENGDTGRRIRIEVEPQAMPSAAGLAPAAPGTWRYAPTEAISRQQLGPEDRAMVGRYFGHDADPP